MTSYFNNLIKRIDTLKELDRFKEELINYKDLVGTKEGLITYWKLFEELRPKIKQVEIKIKNKSLIVVSDNIIAKMFRKIKKYLSGILIEN